MAFAIEHKETKRHLADGKVPGGISFMAECATSKRASIRKTYGWCGSDIRYVKNPGFDAVTCNGVGHIWSRRNGAEQVLAILEKNQPGQWEIVNV